MSNKKKADGVGNTAQAVQEKQRVVLPPNINREPMPMREPMREDPVDFTDAKRLDQRNYPCCFTCEFFYPQQQEMMTNGTPLEHIGGQCRGRAPTPIVKDVIGQDGKMISIPLGFFPTTSANIYCGDWKPSIAYRKATGKAH